LEGKLKKSGSLRVSLSPTQLLYSPCEDLYSLGHGGHLPEDKKGAAETQFVLNTGENCTVQVRRGRNRNIVVGIDKCETAQKLASLEHPFTIFSPGLAGVAKTEKYASDGVLVRTIARGDANLMLRNILLRLWRTKNTGEDKWHSFLDDFSQIFPDVSFSVDFNEKTDEFVQVTVSQHGSSFPLELAGTGVLQAVQILSYVHCFAPSVIVLDEPDSHLHPNNQRLLCSLLSTVAEERSTQILLATHSRHVVDALSGQVAFLWVRNGTVDLTKEDRDLAILLDIGALDVKELVGQKGIHCIVLTEDALKRSLEILIESCGFQMKSTAVLPYYGCTSPHNLRALLSVIRGTNPNAKIIVHGDRDYFTDAEVDRWATDIRALQAEPFLTDGVDIESHFLNARHLAKLNAGLTENYAQTLINQATKETRETSIQKYVNGRVDIEKKRGTYGKLDIGKLATDAPRAFDSNPERYRHSKTVMKKLRDIYRANTQENLITAGVTEHLAVAALESVAKRVIK
jgi:energy-coupling factor transporter ATP-binding protein EcfA2